MAVKQKHSVAWFVWFLASFFYAYQYILRVLPNIMMPDIMQKYHIDAGVFGQYSGLYYLGYAGMHIPLGLMLDKFGPKKVLPVCMILTVLGIIPLLLSESWVFPILGRFLIGIGSSAAILGVFKVVRMTFTEQRFTRMLGFSVTIGLLGAIYGGQPVNFMLKTFGYESVLKMIALLGVCLAFITYWIVPAIEKPSENTSVWQDIKAVFQNKQVLTICLLAGLMVGPLEGFADVWGKQYLITSYGLSDSLASTMPSLIFLGMCVGSTLMSLLAEKTKAYFEIIILSALGMGGMFALLLLGLFSVSYMSIAFIFVGILCAYQILAIYKASTYVPDHLVSLTTAVANMIIMTFGYFFHSVIGKMMSLFWDGAVYNNTPLYNAESFTYGLSVIPIALIIAAFGFMVFYVRDKQKGLYKAEVTAMKV